MNATEDRVDAKQVAQAPILPIAKVHARDLSYDRFLREYVALNKPVVIIDPAPDWIALKTWTPEFFKQKYGEQTVEVTYGVQSKLGDVMDGVLRSTASKPGPYLHKVIIHHHMPSLLPDLTPENIYAFPMRYCSPLMPRRFRRPDGYLKLLIGGVGGKFPLMHFDSDNAHAMITEIYGEKEFVLFSPEDTPYVYPHENSPGTSQIDNLDHVDLARFPDFPKATQYRVVIGPGESIFVPSRWWHSARVVTTSVSVCTNLMHETNWDGFVSLSCDTGGKSKPAMMSKRMYLNVTGLVMGIVERLQKRFPRAPLVRRIAYLSPATPASRR